MDKKNIKNKQKTSGTLGTVTFKTVGIESVNYLYICFLTPVVKEVDKINKFFQATNADSEEIIDNFIYIMPYKSLEILTRMAIILPSAELILDLISTANQYAAAMNTEVLQILTFPLSCEMSKTDAETFYCRSSNKLNGDCFLTKTFFLVLAF